MNRHLVLAGALACLPCSSAARAQHVEEQAAEKIHVPDAVDASGKRPDLADVAKRIVERTTAFRKKEGRPPIAVDDKLTAAAQNFAEYMARNDEYGHTADGNLPGERAKRQGYDYCLIAENIAYAFDSAGFDAEPLSDRFEVGWEKSPGHRRNMLDPDATQIGVAITRSDKTGYYYAVQEFGRPKSAAIAFAVENRSGEMVAYTIGEEAFDLPPRITRTHTRCRPAELTFRWPGGATAATTPTTGNRLLVTKGPGGFAVKKE